MLGFQSNSASEDHQNLYVLCWESEVTRVEDSDEQETQESPGLGHEVCAAVYNARRAS